MWRLVFLSGIISSQQSNDVVIADGYTIVGVIVSVVESVVTAVAIIQPDIIQNTYSQAIGSALFLLAGVILGASVTIWKMRRSLRDHQTQITSETSNRDNVVLDDILNNTIIGIALIDLNGYVLTANQAIHRFWGYSQQSLVGKHFSEFIHPEDLAESVEFNQALLRGECNNYVIDKRYVRADGTTVWGRLTVSPICHEDGSLQYISITVEDITAYKQAEDDLLSNQQFLQKIANTVPQILYLFDLQKNTPVYLNQRSIDVLGYSPEEICAANRQWLIDHIYPDDRYLLENNDERFMHMLDTDVASIEYRFRHQNGEWRWLNAREVVFARDENGVPIQILGSIQDISSRKWVEAALWQSEETAQQRLAEIEAIYTSVPIGLCVLDRELRFVRINQQLAALNGMSVADHLGRSVQEVLQEMGASQEQILQQVIQTGQAILDVEICSNFPDRPNEERNWLVNYYPLKGDDGQVMGINISVQEFTKQKQAEIRLRQQAERERLLRAMTQHIGQSLDLDEILTSAINQVRQTFQADRALIFRLHSDGSGQVIKESVLPNYSITDELLWTDECFPLECYEYYCQGQPRIVLDIATDDWSACLAEFMQQLGVKSKIVAPITQTAQGTTKLWGLLIVHACSYQRQWQPDEAELLQQISNQLGIAIYQADLYRQLQIELAQHQHTESALIQAMEREQQLREQERLISTIAQNIRQFLDLNYILATVTEEVRRFLQVDRVVVYQFNSDWNGKVIAESLVDPVFSIAMQEINDPCFAASRALTYRQGRLHTVNDIYTANLDPCYVNFLSQLQVRAVLVIPILVNYELWGLLIAHQCHRPYQWQQVGWHLLRQLGTQLAIGIHQSQLYQKLQQLNPN